MFASRGVGEHLLRGVGGLGALAAAVYTVPLGWPPLVLLPVGFFLLRGCPMCWLVGLVQTVLQRDTSHLCTDGSCALRDKPPGHDPGREQQQVQVSKRVSTLPKILGPLCEEKSRRQGPTGPPTRCSFVIDFGTARLPGALTETMGLPEGVLHLLPPELLAYTRIEAEKRGELFHGGAPADLYALGVLLYQGLTDRPPFRPEAHPPLFREEPRPCPTPPALSPPPGPPRSPAFSPHDCSP